MPADSGHFSTLRAPDGELSFNIKRSLFLLQNRIVPDIQQKRTDWQQYLSEKDTGHLVFLDESVVNINMTRYYARAQSNQRTVDSAPLNTSVTATILSSIRLDGTCVYTIYQGGNTVERFQQYLAVNLLPIPGPDDIIIMDNMRSHHTRAVKDFLGKNHIKHLYLSPSSPTLNPVKKYSRKSRHI